MQKIVSAFVMLLGISTFSLSADFLPPDFQEIHNMIDALRMDYNRIKNKSADLRLGIVFYQQTNDNREQATFAESLQSKANRLFEELHKMRENMHLIIAGIKQIDNDVTQDLNTTEDMLDTATQGPAPERYAQQPIERDTSKR